VSGPDPATAAIRLAVRGVLAECLPGELVLVACSGGADSLALAAATAFEAPAVGVRAGVVVVDHGLQDGSAAVAQAAAEACRALGLDPAVVKCTEVLLGPGGPEAVAREARYAVLSAVADEHGARLVLLGHTRDDQAEQVLLGLARGAGARSLAGMPRTRDRFRRPLLGVAREQTRASCRQLGLSWWEDPMNEDQAFTRVRARRALRDLERDLGPGVSAALARSADQLREDADHLDSLAQRAVASLGPGPWEVSRLVELPRAVRTRVWRLLTVAAGAPAGQVSTRHTEACDALLTRWHGQGPVSLPGPLAARRAGGRVSIAAPDPVE
jgi:tRNA(Ile)-lysidine synthase